MKIIPAKTIALKLKDIYSILFYYLDSQSPIHTNQMTNNFSRYSHTKVQSKEIEVERSQ
jgi:hypothetical protein